MTLIFYEPSQHSWSPWKCGPHWEVHQSAPHRGLFCTCVKTNKGPCCHAFGTILSGFIILKIIPGAQEVHEGGEASQPRQCVQPAVRHSVCGQEVLQIQPSAGKSGGTHGPRECHIMSHHVTLSQLFLSRTFMMTVLEEMVEDHRWASPHLTLALGQDRPTKLDLLVCTGAGTLLLPGLTSFLGHSHVSLGACGKTNMRQWLKWMKKIRELKSVAYDKDVQLEKLKKKQPDYSKRSLL